MPENGNGKITDHDMLITLNAQMAMLCKAISKLEAKVDNIPTSLPCHTQMDKCDKKFETVDEKLGRRVKHNLITILLVIIAGVVGFNFTLDASQWASISSVKTEIIEVIKKVDRHNETAKGIIYRIERLEDGEKNHD